MNNYQDRVRAEYTELAEKWYKLGQFLGNVTLDMLEKMGDEEYTRLKKQYSVMEEYVDILAERIDSFSK